jgi:hypothetical protein
MDDEEPLNGLLRAIESKKLKIKVLSKSIEININLAKQMDWRDPNYRFRLPTGGYITVRVRWTDTMKEVKEMIEVVTKIIIWRQRLVFANREMKNETMICDNSLQKDATLYLVIEAEQKSESKCVC